MIHRPCLSCGSENERSATACGRCGRPLSAWAERLPLATPSRAIRRMPSRRVLLALGLAVALAVAWGPTAWRWLSHRGEGASGPTWRDPASIARWATGELESARLPPVTVEARIETRALAPRRLVLTAHPTGQALLDVVRAAGRLLVAARERGEATATHLAIVRHGTRVILLPVGDAARVAGSDEGAAEWLDHQERLRLAPTEDAGPMIMMGPEWPPPASSGIVMGPPPRDGRDGLSLEPAAAIAAEAQPATPPEPSAQAAQPTAPSPPPPRGVTARGTPKPPAGAADAGAAPIRLLKTSAGPPIPSRVQPSQSGVVLLRFQVHPGTRRALRLDALTVRARGTLPDVEDIAFVDLVRDVDRDGKRGPADLSLGGRQSFNDDDGTLTFEGLAIPFGEDGTGVEMILTADLSDESLGGTVLLAMQDPSAVSVVEVGSGAPCGVRGVPLTGPVIVVDANVEADPEQARLDALAEAGPDAVDENLNRPTSSPENPDSSGPMPATGATGPSGPSGASGATGSDGNLVPRSPFPRRR